MKVLIIKSGLTETFDLSSFHSPVVSLGDVLRTTALLHVFRNADVTWLTSPEARPLLEHNPLISYLETSPSRLRTYFDVIINLERSVLPEDLRGKVFLGFDDKGTLQTCSGIFTLEGWLSSPPVKNMNWSEKLFHLVGKTWSGQNYILVPREERNSTIDLGLNWKVGPKWPSKSWPREKWEELNNRVSGAFKVSWQEGFESIPDYISWIQTCRTLLTHDSLGLHIGLALGKPMTALFGPTTSREIPLDKTIILSLAENSSFSCPPCYQEHCRSNIHCVGSISVDSVEQAVRKNLKDRDGSATIRWEQAFTSS